MILKRMRENNMKIVIFGATGGIGRFAVKYALEAGYEVSAYVRDPKKAQSILGSHERLTLEAGSIDDAARMAKVLKGKDAVIWCVGIPLKRSYAKMESLEGHVNLIAAMDKAGVRRLIDWGTPSVPSKRDKRSFITVVPGIMAGIALKKAKEEMLAIGALLEESDLDWTMVRFMAPFDGARTGKVKVGFGDVKMSMRVSRADIADFMVKQLASDEYLRSMPIIGS